VSLPADPGRPGCAARTLVAIVNYRTAPLVVACLRSLATEDPLGAGRFRVLVVDNASGDGSAAHLRQAIADEGWEAWAEVREAPRNGGFSYGNNVAVREALRWPQVPDQIWLLNPDTVVRPGAVAALVGFLERHPRAGIVGTGIDNDDGQSWPYAFRFPSIASEFENGVRLGLVTRLLRSRLVARRMGPQAQTADWVSGASMVVRREVFEQAGLMDEGYFLYYEETDLCRRARQAGWEVWYEPAARVMHIAGQSTGVTGRQTVIPRRPAYWFESRRRYFVKHHGRAYGAVADLAWILGFSIWRVRRRLQRKEDTDPPRMLSDFITHSVLWRPRWKPEADAEAGLARVNR
jgi:N-acetylglucosaminyl-diphospho-decaprenol L-rhamnosyltransferase